MATARTIGQSDLQLAGRTPAQRAIACDRRELLPGAVQSLPFERRWDAELWVLAAVGGWPAQ